MDGKALGVLAALSGDVGLIPVDQIQPLRLLDQPGPEVRMGDGDQVHRPLPDVLSLEVGDPALGDHVLDVPPRQGNAGAGVEGGNDPRYFAVAGAPSRWWGQQALSRDGAEGTEGKSMQISRGSS